MTKYFMALDQGTTSSRAIIFDETLKPLASSSEAYEQHYPQNGYVEHEPDDLINTTVNSAVAAMAKLGIAGKDIQAIGITNQRETTLVWDKKTGECIHRAIVWQCRRTADICKVLKEEGLEPYVKQATGLIIDPYFSGTKIKWILDNVPNARKRAENGELLFGTVDTYLIWKLSNGKAHVTDYTNASRTMLFNIRTLDWDDKLLKRLGIPRCMLPKVVPSSGFAATCDHPAFGHAPIPITGIAGDQQSALAGQYCDQYGDMKITYGTGAFLLLNTGDRFIESRNGLLTTLGAGTRPGKPEYVLEGSVFMAGAIMQWLRDGLGILPDTSKTAEIATSVKDTGGVCLVPAFTGLGAPHWNAQARASLTGMTRATTYREIIRAADEAIAFQCADLIKAMEQDMQAAAGSIRVDGGAARDEFLLQFQADMLNHDIERPDYVESTALGAVRLAMMATGLAAKRGEGSKTFKPRMSEAERTEHLARWKKALQGVLDAAK